MKKQVITYYHALNKRIHKSRYFVVTFLFLACLILLAFNKDFMQTFALATTVRPETFTELYFEKNTQLPITVTQNQTITFVFTVHNLEYQTDTYPYEVTLNENGNKIVIDKGQFTLNQDQYKTISESYTVAQAFTSANIAVKLTNKNQTIFFLIAEPTPTIPPSSVTKITTTQTKIVNKQYGAWYWLPKLQKALVWLGFDKSGQGIWGSHIPGNKKTK